MDEVIKNLFLLLTGVETGQAVPEAYYDELVPGHPYTTPMTIVGRIFPNLTQEDIERHILLEPVGASSVGELLLARLSGVTSTGGVFPLEWSEPLSAAESWSRPDFVVDRFLGPGTVDAVQDSLRGRAQEEHPQLRQAMQLYQYITGQPASNNIEDWTLPLHGTDILTLVSRFLRLDIEELKSLLVTTGFVAPAAETPIEIPADFLPPPEPTTDLDPAFLAAWANEWIHIRLDVARPFAELAEEENRWVSFGDYCSREGMNDSEIEALRRFVVDPPNSLSIDTRIREVLYQNPEFEPFRNIFAEYEEYRGPLTYFEQRLTQNAILSLRDWFGEIKPRFREKEFRDFCRVLHALGYADWRTYGDRNDELYLRAITALSECSSENYINIDGDSDVMAEEEAAEEEEEAEDADEEETVKEKPVPKDWRGLENWEEDHKPAVVLYTGYKNVQSYFNQDRSPKEDHPLFNYMDLIINDTGSDQHAPNVVSITNIVKSLGRNPDLILALRFVDRRRSKGKDNMQWIRKDIASSGLKHVPLLYGGSSLVSAAALAADKYPWLQEIIDITQKS